MFERLNLPFYFAEISFISLVDILLVTGLIYTALYLVRGTRAVPMLRGIIFIALLLGFIDNFVAELVAVRWIIRNALPALFIAIPVIFQPEIRRAFTQIGQTEGLWRRFQRRKPHYLVAEILAEACQRLATRHHGALIVIERTTGLQEYIDTGIKINADVTAPLLLSIFHKDTELHDGGVIIRGNRIIAASCVMPLSNTRMGDKKMGLRHRAALGTSEVSDAIILVVSEESGNITIAHRGRLIPRQPQQQLTEMLQTFFKGGRT